jgi:argininosuccinate lyase
MIATSTFDRDRMARALDEGFVTATELADWLVTRQVPFREAHAVVGRIVAHCLSASKGLSELSVEELRRFHPAFDADALAWTDPEQAVERRDLPGGPARKQVAARIVEARARLADPERSAWPWASSDAEVGTDR